MNYDSEKNKLMMFKLVELHKAIFNKANHIITNTGLEIQVEQLPVMMVIFYGGTMSQQDMADKLQRDKSSIFRSISSLEGRGLLAVAKDPFDKRRNLVQLTKEGKKLADKIALEISRIDAMLFECLSPEETTTFESLILKCERYIAGL